METILRNTLGDPVTDAEEESFLLFAQDIPSRSLGFVDSKATTLTVSINNVDLEITQSPGLLKSSLPGGTTGAVLWSITPLLASWLSSPTNILTKTSILTPTSTVLELGAGISGIIPLTLASRVAAYIATDQPYTLRLLRENVTANSHVFAALAKGKARAKPARIPAKTKPQDLAAVDAVGNVRIVPLDWESSDIASLPALLATRSVPFDGVDVLLACDCVYNDALIEPFVRTCSEVCALNAREGGEGGEEGAMETVCVVAQQLRSAEVFESWLGRFMRDFVVWRVGDGNAGEGLGEGSGFVVHVGILKGTGP